MRRSALMELTRGPRSSSGERQRARPPWPRPPSARERHRACAAGTACGSSAASISRVNKRRHAAPRTARQHGASARWRTAPPSPGSPTAARPASTARRPLARDRQTPAARDSGYEGRSEGSDFPPGVRRRGPTAARDRTADRPSRCTDAHRPTRTCTGCRRARPPRAAPPPECAATAAPYRPRPPTCAARPFCRTAWPPTSPDTHPPPARPHHPAHRQAPAPAPAPAAAPTCRATPATP